MLKFYRFAVFSFIYIGEVDFFLSIKKSSSWLCLILIFSGLTCAFF